jgi:hypothetical protein
LTSIKQPWIDAVNCGEVCFCLATIFSALFLIPARCQVISMSNPESEQVLTLLKELSLLKELDARYEAGLKTESEREAHRLRQQRHQEIAEEIKALADQKKSDGAKSALSDHA